jgi:hypothetical protein
MKNKITGILLIITCMMVIPLVSADWSQNNLITIQVLNNSVNLSTSDNNFFNQIINNVIVSSTQVSIPFNVTNDSASNTGPVSLYYYIGNSTQTIGIDCAQNQISLGECKSTLSSTNTSLINCMNDLNQTRIIAANYTQGLLVLKDRDLQISQYQTDLNNWFLYLGGGLALGFGGAGFYWKKFSLKSKNEAETFTNRGTSR